MSSRTKDSKKAVIKSTDVPTEASITRALESKFGATAQFVAAHESLTTSMVDDVDATGAKVGKVIGVGHRLTNPISRRAALLIYFDDLSKVTGELLSDVAVFQGLDEARKTVLVDMAFTLSVAGLRGFERMLKAIEEGDWHEAAYEMGDSLWFVQQPKERRGKLLVMMLTGQLPEEFSDVTKAAQAELAAWSRMAFRSRMTIPVVVAT